MRRDIVAQIDKREDVSVHGQYFRSASPTRIMHRRSFCSGTLKQTSNHELTASLVASSTCDSDHTNSMAVDEVGKGICNANLP